MIPHEIIQRVQSGKKFARKLSTQTHTTSYGRESPSRKLTAKEIELNRHNAKAERDYCAKLLRAGRKGMSPIQAHWFANGKEVAA